MVLFPRYILSTSDIFLPYPIQYRETQLEFYVSPDLNIFQRSKQLEFDEDIRKLIDDTTDHGFSLFIVLISQSEAFSYNMEEMLTQIPKLNHFKAGVAPGIPR